MEIKQLNYLLHSIYLNKDKTSFNKLYYSFKDYVYFYIKKAYKRIKDKFLYSIKDLMQETWFYIWKHFSKKDYHFKSIDSFKKVLNNIINKNIRIK